MRRLHLEQHAGFHLAGVYHRHESVGIDINGIVGGLRTASRAWDGGVSRVEELNRIYLVRDLLRRQLNQARPIPLKTENKEPRIAFAGAAQAVEFVAPLPAHLGPGGLYVIRIGVSKDDDRRQLVMYYQLFHPDTGGFVPSKEWKREVLLEPVDGVSLAYFGKIKPDDPPEWYERWLDRDQLPSLVWLSVKFPVEQATVWPQFVVAPLLEGIRVSPEPARRRPLRRGPESEA